MGNYPVFSPAQPNIDVRLFGEAAQAGVQLGQAIPSMFTSITQGAIQGYQTGQNIQAKNIAIDTAQAQDQIAQSQARIETATEGAQTLANKDVLALRANAAESALDYSKQEDNFYSEMKGATPAQQAEIVLGGKYSEVFAKNKNLFTQQLDQIYSDPENGVAPDVRNRIGNILKVHSATDYRQRQAEQYLDKFNGAKEALIEQPYIGQAVQQLGTTPEHAAQDVELIPHGSVQTKDGEVVLDPRAGGWAKNPGYNPDLAKGSYDAISRSTGRVIDDTGSIGNDAYKIRNSYLTTRGMVNGTYLQNDISQIEQKPKTPVSTQGSTSLPVFPQNTKPNISTSPNVEVPGAEVQTAGTPEDRIGFEIAKTANVNPVKFTENAGGSLSALSNQVEQYVNSPHTRGSVEFLMQHGDTVRNLSRAITDTQFEDSPALKAQYTQSHVAEYNRSLSQEFEQRSSRTLGVRAKLDVAVLDAFRPVTPQDLYYIRQAPLVQSSINKYVDGLITNLESRSTAIPNSQRASTATLSFLSGVSRNVSPGQ